MQLNATEISALRAEPTAEKPTEEQAPEKLNPAVKNVSSDFEITDGAKGPSAADIG